MSGHECAHATTRRALLAGAAAGVVSTLVDRADADLDAYPLDNISRKVGKHGPVVCPKVKLVTYKGKYIRYGAPARVFEYFADRLKLFEQVARQTGVDIYGRPPRRLAHLGTYYCRRIAAYPEWISEHGLGNALDLEGFDFGALPSTTHLPSGTPRMLIHPFSVRVVRHWKGTAGVAKTHSTFLRTLARRLVARKDIFRVLLGPAYPGHHDHFHLDCAPYRLVEIFENP